MRILMRNTVFKTGALASLFLCLLALGGVFPGITTSVHAITASEVQTEADLKQFVEEAVDEYYINHVIKETCDFSKIPKLDRFQSLIPNLSTLTVEEIKPLIGLFSSVPLTRADIDDNEACDFNLPFSEVFGGGAGDWKSGSIYLFVMDYNGKVLFNGNDPSIEGSALVAEDEGGRDVRQLIIEEAETPRKAGIVEYCWDDPDVPGDEIVDSNEKPIAGKAPGDSWKKSYVVDPFVSLGAPALSGSPGVIFGSGIYPTGRPPAELVDCDGDGMESDGDGMDGDGDGMDGDGDGMDGDGDGDGDGIVDTVKEVAESGGCAIAAGGDSTPRSNAFNLLLIVSALFLAVSFGNRAMDKRNGVRS